MAKVYRSERWADGDTLYPDDINAELENYASEMNGHLDRDNVDNGIMTGAKVALDTFNVISFDESDGGDFITRDAGHQELFTILSGTITTGDGRLEMQGEFAFDAPSLGRALVDLVLLVDGTVVGRSGCSSELNSDASDVIAAPPVGPGTHSVALAIRINPDSTLTGHIIQANARTLWVRYMRR